MNTLACCRHNRDLLDLMQYLPSERVNERDGLTRLYTLSCSRVAARPHAQDKIQSSFHMQSLEMLCCRFPLLVNPDQLIG